MTTALEVLKGLELLLRAWVVSMRMHFGDGALLRRSLRMLRHHGAQGLVAAARAVPPRRRASA